MCSYMRVFTVIFRFGVILALKIGHKVYYINLYIIYMYINLYIIFILYIFIYNIYILYIIYYIHFYII